MDDFSLVIFQTWSDSAFVLQVYDHLMFNLIKQKISEQAILPLDNVSSHPRKIFEKQHRKVLMKCLPPSVVYIIQPIDQQAISCLKE